MLHERTLEYGKVQHRAGEHNVVSSRCSGVGSIYWSTVSSRLRKTTMFSLYSIFSQSRVCEECEGVEGMCVVGRKCVALCLSMCAFMVGGARSCVHACVLMPFFHARHTVGGKRRRVVSRAWLTSNLPCSHGLTMTRSFILSIVTRRWSAPFECKRNQLRSPGRLGSGRSLGRLLHAYGRRTKHGKSDARKYCRSRNTISILTS